ncbi:hypothetical protein ACI1TR_05960 [Lactococcus garvieae]|uniref:hypothetical protein n=1 Tax=Lactococcus garvieae TaxID=1363 RepID=UPI003854FF29
MNKKLRPLENFFFILIGGIAIYFIFKHTYNQSSVLEYIFLNMNFIILVGLSGLFSHIVIIAIADNIKLLKGIPANKFTEIDRYASGLSLIFMSVFPIFLLLGHFDEKFFTVVGIPIAVSISLFNSYKKFFKLSRPDSNKTLNNSRGKRKKHSNRKHYKRLKR